MVDKKQRYAVAQSVLDNTERQTGRYDWYKQRKIFDVLDNHPEVEHSLVFLEEILKATV